MKPIDRRLAKIENDSGPPGDLTSIPDWRLHAIICDSLTVDCRAGKTIEEIAAAYQANGEPEVAEIISECYTFDPETQTVRVNESVDRGDWMRRRLRRSESKRGQP